ncbi:MAG: GNAT family N-acetyltransferase [Ornithinimicrobium sp.]
MTYRWDHLRLDDVDAWAGLIDALALADDTDEHYSPEELDEELHEHGLDPKQDTIAVWDGDALIGFGQVRASAALNADGHVRVWLSGGVHPDHRGRGIGRRLLELSEARGAVLARERHPGAPAFWRADGNLEGASVRPLLERRGYAIVRYFNQMKRPIPGESVAEIATAGAQIIVPSDGQSEALRCLHNQAFEDHWGSAPVTREAWQEHWGSVSSRRSMSSVALGDDGELLAYVLCGQHHEGVLYVNIVGTHRAARGRGLAKACLNATIVRASASGRYHTIELHVDSVSPTGATVLYERLGFRATKVFAAYQRPVTEG